MKGMDQLEFPYSAVMSFYNSVADRKKKEQKKKRKQVSCQQGLSIKASLDSASGIRT
jgi:hypothetical protein